MESSCRRSPVRADEPHVSARDRIAPAGDQSNGVGSATVSLHAHPVLPPPSSSSSVSMGAKHANSVSTTRSSSVSCASSSSEYTGSTSRAMCGSSVVNSAAASASVPFAFIAITAVGPPPRPQHPSGPVSGSGQSRRFSAFTATNTATGSLNPIVMSSGTMHFGRMSADRATMRRITQQALADDRIAVGISLDRGASVDPESPHRESLAANPQFLAHPHAIIVTTPFRAENISFGRLSQLSTDGGGGSSGSRQSLCSTMTTSNSALEGAVVATLVVPVTGVQSVSPLTASSGSRSSSTPQSGRAASHGTSRQPTDVAQPADIFTSIATELPACAGTSQGGVSEATATFSLSSQTQLTPATTGGHDPAADSTRRAVTFAVAVSATSSSPEGQFGEEFCSPPNLVSGKSDPKDGTTRYRSDDNDQRSDSDEEMSAEASRLWWLQAQHCSSRSRDAATAVAMAAKYIRQHMQHERRRHDAGFKPQPKDKEAHYVDANVLSAVDGDSGHGSCRGLSAAASCDTFAPRSEDCRTSAVNSVLLGGPNGNSKPRYHFEGGESQQDVKGNASGQESNDEPGIPGKSPSSGLTNVTNNTFNERCTSSSSVTGSGSLTAMVAAAAKALSSSEQMLVRVGSGKDGGSAGVAGVVPRSATHPAKESEASQSEEEDMVRRQAEPDFQEAHTTGTWPSTEAGAATNNSSPCDQGRGNVSFWEMISQTGGGSSTSRVAQSITALNPPLLSSPPLHAANDAALLGNGSSLAETTAPPVETVPSSAFWPIASIAQLRHVRDYAPLLQVAVQNDDDRAKRASISSGDAALKRFHDRRTDSDDSDNDDFHDGEEDSARMEPLMRIASASTALPPSASGHPSNTPSGHVHSSPRLRGDARRADGSSSGTTITTSASTAATISDSAFLSVPLVVLDAINDHNEPSSPPAPVMGRQEYCLAEYRLDHHRGENPLLSGLVGTDAARAQREVRDTGEAPSSVLPACARSNSTDSGRTLRNRNDAVRRGDTSDHHHHYRKQGRRDCRHHPGRASVSSAESQGLQFRQSVQGPTPPLCRRHDDGQEVESPAAPMERSPGNMSSLAIEAESIGGLCKPPLHARSDVGIAASSPSQPPQSIDDLPTTIGLTTPIKREGGRDVSAFTGDRTKDGCLTEGTADPGWREVMHYEHPSSEEEDEAYFRNRDAVRVAAVLVNSAYNNHRSMRRRSEAATKRSSRSQRRHTSGRQSQSQQPSLPSPTSPGRHAFEQYPPVAAATYCSSSYAPSWNTSRHYQSDLMPTQEQQEQQQGDHHLGPRHPVPLVGIATLNSSGLPSGDQTQNVHHAFEDSSIHKPRTVNHKPDSKSLHGKKQLLHQAHSQPNRYFEYILATNPLIHRYRQRLKDDHCSQRSSATTTTISRTTIDTTVSTHASTTTTTHARAGREEERDEEPLESLVASFASAFLFSSSSSSTTPADFDEYNGDVNTSEREEQPHRSTFDLPEKDAETREEACTTKDLLPTAAVGGRAHSPATAENQAVPAPPTRHVPTDLEERVPTEETRNSNSDVLPRNTPGAAASAQLPCYSTASTQYYVYNRQMQRKYWGI